MVANRTCQLKGGKALIWLQVEKRELVGIEPEGEASIKNT